ncbi:MAG: peptidylprolyl isomerase [Gammaproteobacteria bacterium]
MTAVPGRALFSTSICLALVLMMVPAHSVAGTIVRVSTTLGDYSIELFDDIAPVTVQNFLNYVHRNDYNGTYLHRVVDNFVVQGGAYRFQLFVGPVDIPTDPPILNEFSVSNIAGTVAMAKLENVENSATNQWFVNLTDNTELDTTNGGFSVFGQVLGNGLAVLQAIDALPTILLGAKAPSAPYFTAEYNNPLDFIYINVEVVQRYSEAPHVFESASGLLITSVNVNNGEDVVSLNFNAVPSESGVVIQGNPESLIPRATSFDGIATFSSSDNRLRIPQLEVNLGGAVSLVSDVVFVLTSTTPLQFTLESYQQN